MIIFKKEKSMFNSKSDGIVPDATSGNQINALLGKGSEFEGKLVFQGTVRIDGKFKGEIISNDKLLIGEHAEVDAEIKVDSVIIGGNVTGNIEAKSRVEIHAPARLKGNIKTPTLVIEEGVCFDGSCAMDGNEATKHRRKNAEIINTLDEANRREHA